ncbi:unnamed protein product, partial [Prorocentrum cordatum]
PPDDCLLKSLTPRGSRGQASFRQRGVNPRRKLRSRAAAVGRVGAREKGRARGANDKREEPEQKRGDGVRRPPGASLLGALGDFAGAARARGARPAAAPRLDGGSKPRGSAGSPEDRGARAPNSDTSAPLARAGSSEAPN